MIFALALLAMLILPRLADSGYNRRTERVRCLNNLKQLGLGFLIWAGDNGDVYPMAALTNSAGDQLYADAHDLFNYYLVMSNEINNPKVLVCPADKDRIIATNFTQDFKGNRYTSYFIGLDATKTNNESFLAGDYNLTNGTALKNGVLELNSNNPAGWTEKLHNQHGNILLANGSVQMWTTPLLRTNLARAGFTNRLLMPLP